MKTRIVYSAAIGTCLTLVALSAGAQTAADNASHASITAGVAATGAAGKAAVTPGGSTLRHHATTHHPSKAKHEHMAAASPASNQETTYHAALKQCVAGPAGQRESCLDGAIARFGRA